MTDRELLALAAKAAGKQILHFSSDGIPMIAVPGGGPESCLVMPWNPRDDDGDALRLAVKLEFQLRLRHSENEVTVYGPPSGRIDEGVFGDPCAATRRAIVRAAAEIGKGVA